jgi:hypothetical protein
MTDATRPLTEAEHGPFCELAGRPMPPGLVMLFIPSLATLLARAEQLKGGHSLRSRFSASVTQHAWSSANRRLPERSMGAEGMPTWTRPTPGKAGW